MDKLMCLVVIGSLIAAMLQCTAAQTAYLVGDSLGWEIPPSNAANAFATWASNKRFMVGDILMFNFTTNQHDVLQVTKDSYDACTQTNPIGNAITTGPANITLNSAGDHYYICTFGRHCQLGQKLQVTVSGTPGASPPTSNTPPPTTSTTPSPTSNTPDACAPTPSSTPNKDGPAPSTMPESVPPPPGSSSSAVFASFFLTFFAISMGFLL